MREYQRCIGSGKEGIEASEMHGLLPGGPRRSPATLFCAASRAAANYSLKGDPIFLITHHAPRTTRPRIATTNHKSSLLGPWEARGAIRRVRRTRDHRDPQTSSRLATVLPTPIQHVSSLVSVVGKSRTHTHTHKSNLEEIQPTTPSFNASQACG